MHRETTSTEAAAYPAVRKLPARWTIQVCPACNGIIEGISQTHLGGCPNLHKLFVPRFVTVVEAPA